MRVEVRVLGGFAVTVEGVVVDAARWGGRRGQALVKLLALASGHRLHREQVMDALWPEESPEVGAARLHRATHMARNALGDRRAIVVADGGVALWPSAEVVVDAERFEALAGEVRDASSDVALADALDLYGGDVLPDDLYEPWTEPARQRLRDRHLELLRLAGRWDRLVALDPTDEVAHLALAQIALDAGDRAGALRRLDELERLLAEELGVRPSEAAGRLRARADATPVEVPGRASRSGVVTGGLPVPLTPFIGRAVELAALQVEMSAHRLVTATGPGGAGKTRLAIEAARRWGDESEAAVVFVDLVRIGRGGLVAGAIADAAGLPEDAGADRLAILVAALGDARVMIVIDNCEHVADEARVCVEELLSACPSVRVLATSRVRLMLPFERVVNVPGLSLDGTAGASDAERLFIERMVSAGVAAPADEEARHLVVDICRRLDGLALAIELAAGRVPAFGLDGLAHTLDQRIDVLVVGPRAEDRHASMAAAVRWSYDLLGADEQSVLRAGGVFSTPFDLAALAAVAQRPLAVVAAALGRLVDWNLVAARTGSGPTRYRILETIRQHAEGMSVALDEAEELHRGHLAWCLSALATLTRRQPHDDDWCADADLVSAESTRALAWAGERADATAAVAELAEALADVLFERGRPGEAQRLYDIAATALADPTGRRRLLRLAAGAAAARNVGGDAVELLGRAADAARELGDRDAAAHDLAQAVALQLRAGGIMARPAPAALIEEQLDRARELSRGGTIAVAAIAVAEGWAPGSTARSRAHTRAAMAAAERADLPLLLNEALDQLTALEMGDRHLSAALAAVDRRLEVLGAVPVDAASGFEVYDALHMACHVNLATGRLSAARRYADDVAALPFFREERHIGFGRRVEVDAIAGDFDAVIARAELLERDWRRAGRPVAGNLAVGAYAVAMTFGMVGDETARRQWTDITDALLGPATSRSRENIWAAVLDAMLALHRDQPDDALALLHRNPTDPIANANHVLWLPWYAAVWAEASVLAEDPASDARLTDAAIAAAGNEIAVTMIERARRLRAGDAQAVHDLAPSFEALDCPLQADRTRHLAHLADPSGVAATVPR